MEDRVSSRKQSVLMGGLISSAGIFISKFLGLLYVVPFNAILQTAENQSYYSQTFNIYSYVIQIATAGLPFAIATLVARYAARNDYRTCLLVKKISFVTMSVLGVVSALIMILFSGMIAGGITPKECDVDIMQKSIILISLAIFIIPILSSIRGFYQGLKEMEIYSMSQVLEQLVRIIFLLTAGALLVYVFNQDAIWALYFSVIAASVSGLLTIFYIRWKGKSKLNEVRQLASTQELETKADPRQIFKELVYLAIPFLLTAIFGYCDSIINQIDLKPGLQVYGEMKYTAELSSAIFMHATKIIAIPMILSPGFSAAIIPYITSAIEKKHIRLVRKYILECIESVVYIALPICFMLFIFAKPIMFSLFGNANLELDTFVMKWYALEAVCATICPIFSSIVMAIGYRKKIIINTVIFAVIKLLTNRLLISFMGVGGMIISSLIAYSVFSVLNIYIIQKYYKVNWKYTFRKILFMLIGVLAIYLVSIPFNMIGWIDYVDSRVICLCILAAMGIITTLAYLGVTAFFQIPQSIFHIDLSSLVSKVKGKFGR